MDHRFGRYMNHNYAEYHIPVNADIHDIDVIFVSEEDDKVPPRRERPGRSGHAGCGHRREQRHLPRHRQARARHADYD